MAIRPEPNRTRASQDDGVEEIRNPGRAAAPDVGHAPGRDAHAHRCAEDAGAEVGDPVGAQLRVGVGRAERPVPALEMLDHPRGDQHVHGGHDGQPQGGRQDGREVRRLPGEPRDRGQDERHGADGPFAPAQGEGREDRQGDAEEGRRRSRPAPGQQRRGHDHDPAQDDRLESRRAELREHVRELPERLVGPAAARAGPAACGAGG